MYLPQATSGVELARLVAGRTRARGLDRGRALAGRPRDRASRASSRTAPATTTSPTGRPTGASWPTPPTATTRSSCGRSSSRAGKSWPLHDERRREPRSALVARRDAGSRSSRRRSSAASTCSGSTCSDGRPGDAGAPHRGPRLRPAPLLLLALRPVPLADLVARRERAASSSRTAAASRAAAACGACARSRARRCARSATRRPPGRPGPTGRATDGAWSTRPTWAASGTSSGSSPRRAATPSRSRYGEFDATAPRFSPDGSAHRLRLERGRRARAVDDPRAGRRAAEGRDPRAAAPRGHGPAARRRDRERPLRAGADLGHDRRTAAASCPRARGATPTTTSTGPSAGSSTATSTAPAAPRSRCPAGPVTLEVTRGLEYRPVRRTLDVAAGETRAGERRARADRRLAGARLVERRPARAHELRRRLPRDARSRCARWPRPRTCTWSST